MAAHDESPPLKTDHKFEPKGEYWTLCVHCNMAAAAHAELGESAMKAKLSTGTRKRGE